MTPQLYDRMWALFDEARERRPDERRAFLDAQCAADPGLRAEVEKLLARADRGAPDLLADPSPVSLKAQWAGPAEDRWIGRHVGAYEVRTRIASGGMGSVYLAVRREDFQQRVAIKVIKPGLEAGAVVRRFRAERQILARLAHPNVARLLDGGAVDGQPYFVMEYVDGVPIDRYCNEHNLGTRERVQLFLTVCAAVHHAHQNMILHRDLKPGNILVEPDGNPKLVDFGIAKVLDPDAPPADGPLTQTGAHFATPDYGSPEQLRGDALPSTACDTYALGVILYELLTGRRPHERDRAPVHEMVRRVCEDEPVPPRRHRPDVPRDLEVICLKCLRKEPHARFASAAELAEELRRYLAGEPIRARPVGATERALKWVRRRPVAAAMAVTAALALGAVVAVVFRDNHRLNASNRRVEASERVVADLLGDLIGVLGADGSHAPPDVSVRQLRIIETRIRQLIDEHRGELADNPRLGQHLGQLLEQVGAQYYQLGRDPEAKGAYELARELQRQLVAVSPDSAEFRNDLAVTLHALSVALRREHLFAESEERGREALRLHRELAASHPDAARYREQIARHLHHLADLHKDQWTGSPTAAELADVRDLYSQARELLLALIEQHPDEVRYQLALAANYHSWGHALFRAGVSSYGEARAQYDLAVARFDGLLARDPTVPDYRHEQARLFGSTALLLEKQGDREAAVRMCQNAVAVQRDLTAAYPTVTRYRFELARKLTHLGDLFWKDERPKAERAYRAAEQERRRLLSDAPWRANCHGELGLLLWRITERTPPTDPAAIRAHLTEAAALLARAAELGAHVPTYEETRQKIRKRLER